MRNDFWKEDSSISKGSSGLRRVLRVEHEEGRIWEESTVGYSAIDSALQRRETFATGKLVSVIRGSALVLGDLQVSPGDWQLYF